MTGMPFRKGTAYVTRLASTGIELLTFIHPLAGRQLPAGSIEEGEDPLEGIQREVWEETGVRGFERIALLDIETICTKDIGFLRIPQDLRAAPDKDAAVKCRLPRGYKVLIEEEHGGWARISHRTFDFNVNPPAVLREDRGWVPRDQVTPTLERWHYHMVVSSGPCRSWLHEADGHIFQVEWVPLSASLRLVSGQQEWLQVRLSRLESGPRLDVPRASS